MPALRIDDGYTVPFETDPVLYDTIGNAIYDGLPVITGEYRPPSYKRFNRYLFDHGRATSGDAQTQLTCEFIAERIASWDVTYGDKPAPLDKGLADFLADRIGEPFVSQLLKRVSRWAPKGGWPKKEGEGDATQEADAGN